MGLNSEIEFHDTTVAAIVKVGTQVIVFLQAYVHKSPGRPGWDAGSGWVQAAAITFTEATIDGEVPDLPADISSGSLILDDEERKYMVPIPFQYAREIALKMLLITSSAEITIKGKQAELTLIGEAVYVEEFSGHDSP
jgi:hypothetical protein